MAGEATAKSWAAVGLVLAVTIWLPAWRAVPVTRPSEMRYVEAARQMDVNHSGGFSA